MNYYTAVSPFWFVAVSVCRRSGLLLIAVSPFWFVAVLVSPFWRVAVLVCRRFDHTLKIVIITLRNIRWSLAIIGWLVIRLGFTLAVPITILYNHRLSTPLLSMQQQHMLAVNRDL